jgi:DNA-binding CsgD family transcriptional regulator/tetratricopeptide (TPR) repeat protein
LIERDVQVQELLDIVEAARDGQSSTVLLTGEAGVGKTSLIRELTAAIDPDVRVLVGSCDDFLAPPPLQPLRDAFRRTAGPLERALAADDPKSAFDAILAEFARPTVLIVEDMHWADDATLDLLRYLVRRLDQLTAAVVVLTYREDSLDPRHPLRTWLGALTDVRMHRIPLPPLSLDAVRSIAADSGRDAAELYELTGGNPFYLTEVLAAPADTIPSTVVDAVLARFRRLDPESLAVVEQLSVIPAPIPVQYIAEVIKYRLNGLTQAEQAGVVETHGDVVAFRHELTRRAIEQTLPPVHRRMLNAHILQLMLRCGGEHRFQLVHHALEAGDIDLLLEHAPRAAREASRAGSHRQALAHLEAVLPYAERLALPARAALIDAHAWELHIAHKFAEAVEAGRRAVELFEQLGESVELAESLIRQARCLYMAGETDCSMKTVDRAIEVADGTGSTSVQSAAKASRGMLLVLTGSPKDAVALLEEAHELAVEAGRTDIDALCHNYLGLAWCDLGSPAGLPSLRTSITLALTTGDYEAVARGYTNLAEMLYRRREWVELEDCLRRGLEFVREHGFGSHAYNLEVHEALLDLRHGEWPAAEQRLRRLLDSVDDEGMLSVMSRAVLGRLLARRGDPEARDLVVQTWERALEQRSLTGLAYAAAAYSEYAWLTDRPDLVLSIKQELARLAGVPAMTELLDKLPRGWGRSGDPYEEALRLVESGEIESILQGLQILDRLGAAPAMTLARRRLKELGVARIPRGVQARTRQNPAGLTERQLDVLLLLADEMTNPQIAAELVLSVRTVDRHVSAILARLNARTRQEAAAMARSLDLHRVRSA